MKQSVFSCRSCPYLCTSHMGIDLLQLAASAVRLPVSGFEPSGGLPSSSSSRQRRLQEAVPAALRSAGRSASIAARLLASRRPASMLMIHPKTGEVFANVSCCQRAARAPADVPHWAAMHGIPRLPAALASCFAVCVPQNHTPTQTQMRSFITMP